MNSRRLTLKGTSYHLIGIFALLSLLSAFCGDARAADKIVVDFGGLGAFQSTTWVAKDLRIFDKYGLDVDLIMITGGIRGQAFLSRQSVLAKSADLKLPPKRYGTCQALVI